MENLLIVGLGNPGREYSKTRHNIGMMVLEKKFGTAFWKEKFKGEYWIESISGRPEFDKVIYLRPMTFMNLSGQSVQAAATFYKVRPENILVIHDELDLPFGTLVFKQGGGLAGHNGLKSIAALLGTQNFMRMRLGIGRPQHGDVSAHVLSEFQKEERVSLDSFLDLAQSACEHYLREGFDSASRSYSKKIVQ